MFERHPLSGGSSLFLIRNSTPIELSVVLPVYNERESLEILYEKLYAVLNGLQREYEIIFVDDGSTDGSRQVLLKLHEADPRVSLIVQRRNFGRSAALNAAFELAHGDVIITMDSDLQDDPIEIPRFLEQIEAGYDIVSAWKKDRKDPFGKRLQSNMGNAVISLLTGLKLHDINSGYKAFKADAAKRMIFYGELYRYVIVMAHYAGFTFAEISVKHHPRTYGHSKFGAGRMLRGLMDAFTVVFLTRYSRRPMHIFGVAGLVMLIIGFLINLTLTIEWFQGIRPIGDRPVLILGVLLMVMGAQFFTFGLLAELVVSFMNRSIDPFDSTARIYRHQSQNDS